MNILKNGSIDRIELMQTFVRIVDSGSLSAAASQLGTSQPTISRRLQTLETTLGTKLILRTTHAMKLTDDGVRCYELAQGLIKQWTILEDDFNNAKDEPVGTLRVRVPHAFGQDQLISPLVEYLTQHSKVAVEWMLNDQSPDFLSEGIDCAIRVGEITDPSMVAILLAEVPRIVVATPELLANYAPVKQVQDLNNLPWVALSTFYRNKIQLNNASQTKSHELELSPKFSTDSLYALRNIILSHVGVGVASSWIMNDDIAKGKLMHLVPEWSAEPLPVYLVYPYASYYPSRLLKFLEIMRHVMPNLAGTRPPSRRT